MDYYFETEDGRKPYRSGKADIFSTPGYQFKSKFTIVGLGDTLDLAHKDFIINWSRINGFPGIHQKLQEVKKLEEKILDFVKQQEGYKAEDIQRIKVTGSNLDWVVMYGENF